MKILIPYDGTTNAENALLELQKAEFGKDDEILVVITDVFLAESLEEISKTRRKRRLDFESSGTASYIPSRWKLEEERFLTHEIQSRLSTDFPALNITVETLPGYNLVSSELLEKAARWKADLIILGKQKHEFEAAKNGYKPDLWRIVSEARSPVRFAYGANYDSFAIKPDYSFIGDKQSSNGKHISKAQKTSSDFGGLINRQAKMPIQTISSTELFEQISDPKPRRVLRPKRKKKKLATTSTVAV